MTKNKKPTQQTNASKSAKRKKQKRKVDVNMNPKKTLLFGAHTKSACSILNPFCLAAKSARRPDGLSVNSLPYQIRGLVPISTDATGNAILVVFPALPYGTFGGTLTSSVWTLASTMTKLPGSAFVETNAKEVRIVSIGAIFRSTAAMTDCKGVLHTAVAQGITITVNDLAQLAETNLEDDIRPMTSGTEVTWFAKPVGNAAHDFQVSPKANNVSNTDWTTCYFEIAGGPASTQVGYVEIVVNVEIQLIGSKGLGAIAPPPTASNPIALQAQSKVHTSLPGIIQGGVNAIEQKVTAHASKAVASFFDSAADFGLGLLGL